MEVKPFCGISTEKNVRVDATNNELGIIIWGQLQCHPVTDSLFATKLQNTDKFTDP